MSRHHSPLTGREISFGEEEILVSKTELSGVITYANTVFQRVSSYTESELIGQPHNILRHPAMPRAVFKLLWDTIQNRREIFAYVLNRAKHGDEYWVFAHITPSFGMDGKLNGYHSNRRFAYRDAIAKVTRLYQQMLHEEQQHARAVDAMAASTRLLQQELERNGQSYDEFVFNLSAKTTLDSTLHPRKHSLS
ncbi:MAG: PAS domain-containing protein [Puniceicoccaceae bacterium]